MPHKETGAPYLMAHNCGLPFRICTSTISPTLYKSAAAEATEGLSARANSKKQLKRSIPMEKLVHERGEHESKKIRCHPCEKL